MKSFKGFLKRIKAGHYNYTNDKEEVYLIEKEINGNELWGIHLDHGPFIGPIPMSEKFRTLDEATDFLDKKFFNEK